jgi:large subunit ribosomal protein L18
MSVKKYSSLFEKRRFRIRQKVKGVADRPRLTVRFSHQHIHAQCINDREGKTLVALSSLSKDLRAEAIKPNIEGAKRLGSLFGKKALAAGITKVVFDRAGRRYHGCVKVFADAAREAGVQF